MSKEVEKYFVDRLSAILTDYLQDFSQNNVAKVIKSFFINYSNQYFSIYSSV